VVVVVALSPLQDAATTADVNAIANKKLPLFICKMFGVPEHFKNIRPTPI
jgi:hypothetical protein